MGEYGVYMQHVCMCLIYLATTTTLFSLSQTVFWHDLSDWKSNMVQKRTSWFSRRDQQKSGNTFCVWCHGDKLDLHSCLHLKFAQCMGFDASDRYIAFGLQASALYVNICYPFGDCIWFKRGDKPKIRRHPSQSVVFWQKQIEWGHCRQSSLVWRPYPLPWIASKIGPFVYCDGQGAVSTLCKRTCSFSGEHCD